MTTKTVAVLGTGTMGRGIAQICAAKGNLTRLADIDEARAKSALAEIAATLEKLVQKGKITGDQRHSTMANLSVAPTAKLACEGAEVIVEAVFENMTVKVDLLASVLPVAEKYAIVASNTSSLSITELGTRLGIPERTVGMHFFNPVPVMELLEIVRGLGTSPKTLDFALAFAKELGKTPIVVNDVPGFATSRLGVILGAEAMRMLEQGVASAADIDRGMELGYRHPMGPLRLTDLVGLDVRLAILEHLHREIGEQFRPPSILRQMVRAGKLGKKSGEGFYKWENGEAKAPEGPARL